MIKKRWKEKKKKKLVKYKIHGNLNKIAKKIKWQNKFIKECKENKIYHNIFAYTLNNKKDN